jgi:hypothetical protein
MPKAPPATITVCCMLKIESSNLSFEPTELILQLREKLEKRLLKKGFATQWVPQTEEPTLLVHLVRIDEGSRLLRYIAPFISPAVMEVEGRVKGTDPLARTFHYVQKAQVGLLGGSAKSMMKANVDRLAVKIVKDVVKALRR